MASAPLYEDLLPHSRIKREKSADTEELRDAIGNLGATRIEILPPPRQTTTEKIEPEKEKGKPPTRAFQNPSEALRTLMSPVR